MLCACVCSPQERSYHDRRSEQNRSKLLFDNVGLEWRMKKAERERGADLRVGVDGSSILL